MIRQKNLNVMILILLILVTVLFFCSMDVSNIRKRYLGGDAVCCRWRCRVSKTYTNRSSKAFEISRIPTTAKQIQSFVIYYSRQKKSDKCQSCEERKCGSTTFSSIERRGPQIPKETRKSGNFNASGYNAILLFSTLFIVVISSIIYTRRIFFKKRHEIKQTEENQNRETKTEKVEMSEIEAIPKAQERIENGHEVEVVTKDVSGEVRLPNAMYGVIRNNGTNWESFIVGRGIIPENELRKLKSKFGVTQDRMKVQILKLWKREHSQMKGLAKEELLQLACDFVNKGLDIDVSNSSFANVCQLVIGLIPNDKWMRFVRLELTLTEKEIRNLRIKYSEFTEEQKYQMLRHALIGRQNLSDVN